MNLIQLIAMNALKKYNKELKDTKQKKFQIMIFVKIVLIN